MEKLYRIPNAWPFLIALFINAFVDLGHKIVIQNIIFRVYDGSTQVALTALVNGLILLPFIVMFSVAGHLSDNRPKVWVMRVSAWAAVVLTLGIVGAYYLGWFWLAFAMTLLLAIQATLYSPAKFGYIKTLFGQSRLAEANGVVQAISIIAILVGTIAFSALFQLWIAPSDASPQQMLKDIAPVSWSLVIFSIIELVMLYRLVPDRVDGPKKPLEWRKSLSGKSVRDDLETACANHVIRQSIIGLAVFWSIGQVLLAAFPSWAKEQLQSDNVLLVQGILAASGIGIAMGSMLASRFSRNRIETGLIPIGALGIAIGLWIMPWLSSALFCILDMIFIGMMGGIFIVPLNALIQFHSNDKVIGTVLAGSNWIQNLAMLGLLILTTIFAMAGISSLYLLLLIAAAALVGGIYTVVRLPQSLVRLLLGMVMRQHYRVDVRGINNIPAEGGVLMLGNHISWVDWAIIQIASPRPIHFVMLKSIYERWYLKWLLKSMGCIPIDQGSGASGALAAVTNLLNSGEVVCLFPEGAISRNGQLGEFRRGFERACAEADPASVIVPFYLRGLWGSHLSRSSTKLKELRGALMHRSVGVSFGSPMLLNSTADVVKRRVFDQAAHSWRHYVKELPSIPEAWVNSVKDRSNELALVDSVSGPLSASKALTGAVMMSRRFDKLSPEQNVGLLLPTSNAGMMANMAALMAGKTVVNLNYTSSQEAIRSALEQADVRTIYTSNTFVKKLEQRGLPVEALLQGRKIVLLEDLRKEFGKKEMLFTLAAIKVLPAALLKILFVRKVKADNCAAILFSSGSEGAPKGVMLSHRNIMANIKQTSDVLNTEGDDVVLASLPLFHAFGLTITQFLPLIEGLPVVAHPDPTDVVGLAKAIAKHKATLMCGTSTFLRLFVRNRKVEPLMLESLRVVVAGAEKLSDEVRNAFQLKFNKPIYEGYGTTETAPVAAVNLPDTLDPHYLQVQRGEKRGTTGMPLPGSSFKIVDPESFTELATGEEGMILISGPQVMMGYLNDPQRTATAIHNMDGERWYVTGDKGHLDEDGFLTIVDRYSRFAKIGGEMVSLGAVERAIAEAVDNSEIEVMAVNLPDETKGEVIVALYDQDIDTTEIRKRMLAAGHNPLMVPSKWLKVDELPHLGTGKADVNTAKKMAMGELEN